MRLTAVLLVVLGGRESQVQVQPSSKVNYLGQSLGAILRVPVMATDPLPKTANLNVPGAPLPDLIFGWPEFAEVKQQLLAAQNVSEGSLGYLKLLTTFNWIIDPGDPGNFAPYLQQKQLLDVVASAAGNTTVQVPKKQVMVQLERRTGHTNPVRSAPGLGDRNRCRYAGQNHLRRPGAQLPATAVARPHRHQRRPGPDRGLLHRRRGLHS
jgi:hypothetical protein